MWPGLLQMRHTLQSLARCPCKQGNCCNASASVKGCLQWRRARDAVFGSPQAREYLEAALEARVDAEALLACLGALHGRVSRLLAPARDWRQRR